MKTYVNNFSRNNWSDIQLMNYCKNNIIATSSFIWWGAWLNNINRKIIIVPRK